MSESNSPSTQTADDSPMPKGSTEESIKQPAKQSRQDDIQISAQASNQTPAWRSIKSIGLFILISVGLLIADLAVKNWAFDTVANYPIQIKVDGAGEPQVYVATDVPEDQAPDQTFLAQFEAGEIYVEPHGDNDVRIWMRQPRANPDYPASAIPAHDAITVIPGLLDLQLTINTGAVFGMGKGFRFGFILISVVAVGLIGFFFAASKQKDWLFHIALGLILSGALGNLYDRYFFAAVRDMFLMLPELGLWPWIFNVADVALLAGVGLAFIHTYRSGKSKPAH